MVGVEHGDVVSDDVVEHLFVRVDAEHLGVGLGLGLGVGVGVGVGVRVRVRVRAHPGNDGAARGAGDDTRHRAWLGVG